MKTKFHFLLSFTVLLCLGNYLSLLAQTPTNLKQTKTVIMQKTKSEYQIKELIDQMSLEEKVAMVHGVGMDIVENLGEIDGRVPGAGGETFKIDRLGIPSIIVSDGPAGLRIKPYRKGETRTYFTTIFPSGTALASSWNQDLMYEVGEALGEEVKEYGVDVLLAPGINIQRNPLNGRNFEYMSEDPVVSGLLSAAFINGAQSKGIGTSLKHYAANNSETNRLYSNSLVSERAMREIYLRGFEIAVKKSQPWTIMTSYNKMNGKYTNERKDLNTQILRNEWDYKGLVMTDWFAGFPNKEAMIDTVNTNDVGAEISSGNDLIMPGSKQQMKRLIEDVKNGKVTMQDLDTSVARVLHLVFKSPASYKYKYNDNPDLAKHSQVARKAAAEGVVLLKNNAHTLPLDLKYKRIALFGVDSYNLILGGSGSSDVYRTFLNPFNEGFEKQGAIIDSDLKFFYQPYVDKKIAEDKIRRDALNVIEMYSNIPQLEISDAMLNQVAQKNEVAIVTFGRNSGETFDLSKETDFHLLDNEISLLKRVSETYRKLGKKVVVILNVGSPIETESWKHLADAILVSWFTGQEGGNAMADIIGGTINPSGKLTVSFPNKYEDVPSANSFFGLPVDNPTDMHYTEGIYVGYRYYDSFDIKTSFPFGYGLSYTNFEYSNLDVSGDIIKGNLIVHIKVTNTGEIAGAESVQLYIQNPKGYDSPAKELRNFSKTKVLLPGESQVLKMKLEPKDFSYFDTNKNAWIVRKGEYEILIGKSSTDIVQREQIQLPQAITIEKVKKAFVEKLPFKDLKRK